MITDLADTLPAWLGGIGGILAATIAGVALIRSDRRHVEWQLANERDPSTGRRKETWRLVNTTSGVSAIVTDFDNASEGRRDAIRGEVALPAQIDPGQALIFNHSRSLASPFPTIIRISWKEKATHGFKRWRTYSSTLYVE